jgi:hypothetical protein
VPKYATKNLFCVGTAEWSSLRSIKPGVHKKEWRHVHYSALWSTIMNNLSSIL